MDDSTITSSKSELEPSTTVDRSHVTEEPDDDMSVKAARFLRLLWTKRRVLFFVLTVGISLSLASAFIEPNQYTATTTLMPPDNTSSYSSMLSLLTSSSSAASLGSEALGLNTPGELFVAILGSRNVLNAQIKQFDLMGYYKVRLAEDARKALLTDTKVVQDRKSGVITISVTVRQPDLAAKLAQGYVAELNRVMMNNSTSSARRERIFLEGRIKEVKQQLDDSATALSRFSTKSGAIDVPAQAKSMMDAGVRLQAELIDGRGRLAALRQVYSEDNARVRAAEARIEELQRQINAMGGMSKVAEAGSDAKVSAYPTVRDLPALGVTYYDLERTLKVDEALWENLTKQYEVARVQEAQQIPTLRVLDVATVPERKSGPSRRFIVTVGFVVSLISAVILVLAIKIWEDTDPGEEPKKLALEVIDGVLDRRLWIWKVPLLKQFRSLLNR